MKPTGSAGFDLSAKVAVIVPLRSQMWGRGSSLQTAVPALAVSVGMVFLHSGVPRQARRR